MDVKIFHMASFSRSGETLLLRCLDAHPQIEVVHQVREPDTPEDMALFRHLMTRRDTTMPSDDPLLAHRTLAPGSILLLKNAVWCHAFPRDGFCLVRNPFSIAVSAYRNGPGPAQAERQKAQQIRWARTIDKRLVAMQRSDPTLTGFCALYNRKMLQDRHDGLPFLRYEDFIVDPEPHLRRIIALLGLDWSDRVLHSHEEYEEGQLGHGGIKLWLPIHRGSEDKYKLLKPEEASQVYGLTHETLRVYGYSWDGTALTTHANPDLLCSAESNL